MPGLVIDDPERPSAPKHLSAESRAIFSDLVAWLADAGVPIKRADGPIVSMAAEELAEAAKWSTIAADADDVESQITSSQQAQRHRKAATDILLAIGGSPLARARLGLRGKTEPKKLGTVASILQMKRAASGG
jgi:hypothetical protein